MNELIEKLSKEANAWYPKGYPSPEGGDEAWQNLVIFQREDLRKFADLIYKDIITVVAAQALMNESALDVFINLKRIYESES